MIHKDLLDEQIKQMDSEKVVAIMFADSGAQGEGGRLDIYYENENELSVFYGNYVYGKLNLALVLSHLRMLTLLSPEPETDVLNRCKRIYLGCGNHLVGRKDLIAHLWFKYVGIHPGKLYDRLEYEIEEYYNEIDKEWYLG